MLIVRFAVSNPSKIDVRAQHLEAHKLWIRTLPLKLLLSGPLIQGESTSAALIVVEADSVQQFQRLCESDPFVRHSVYVTTEIMEWKPTAGMLLEQVSGK